MCLGGCFIKVKNKRYELYRLDCVYRFIYVGVSASRNDEGLRGHGQAQAFRSLSSGELDKSRDTLKHRLHNFQTGCKGVKRSRTVS